MKAAELLSDAVLIAIPLPVLCEFVWVLRRVYQLSAVDIAAAIRALLAAKNVKTNNLAAKQGLELLEADGEVLYSFDKKAVKLLVAQGAEAVLLS